MRIEETIRMMMKRAFVGVRIDSGDFFDLQIGDETR